MLLIVLIFYNKKVEQSTKQDYLIMSGNILLGLVSKRYLVSIEELERFDKGGPSYNILTEYLVTLG
jgi:hypothetical protein